MEYFRASCNLGATPSSIVENKFSSQISDLKLKKNHTWKFSTDPFVLPGKLTISEFPRIPHVSLESIAIGVTFKEPDIIAWTNPGASLSITCLEKKYLQFSS